MYDVNRKGDRPSPQISEMGAIDISTEDFSLSNGGVFCLKNDNADSVTLEVKLPHTSEWISTVFQPGWNPEILVAVKAQAGVSNLKWGN